MQETQRARRVLEVSKKNCVISNSVKKIIHLAPEIVAA